MNLFVRVLVNLVFALFFAIGIVLLLRGEQKSAIGALIVAGLVSPLLFEVWLPRKYVLRKPINGTPDTLINRMKQFRKDHPGWDGTVILGVLALLGVGLSASMLLQVIGAFRLH